jgi:hypothetical protein|tara:strand:- start:985 stop:1209 length:225 start_codon:yes stop_codon:yes gene_type:complete
MRNRKITSFEDFKGMDEGIQSDLKKYIKKHKEELESLADEDQWETIYTQLYTEFDIEPNSSKAKDLRQTFEFIF